MMGFVRAFQKNCGGGGGGGGGGERRIFEVSIIETDYVFKLTVNNGVYR